MHAWLTFQYHVLSSCHDIFNLNLSPDPWLALLGSSCRLPTFSSPSLSVILEYIIPLKLFIYMCVWFPPCDDISLDYFPLSIILHSLSPSLSVLLDYIIPLKLLIYMCEVSGLWWHCTRFIFFPAVTYKIGFEENVPRGNTVNFHKKLPREPYLVRIIRWDWD